MALLVVVMGPFLVLSMVAVHFYAPPNRKPYSLAALAFMASCVTVTTCINFLLLVVSSRPNLFSESWRSLFPSVQVAGSTSSWTASSGIGSSGYRCCWPAPIFGGDSLKGGRVALCDDLERCPMPGWVGLACGFALHRPFSWAVILGWGAAGPIVFLLLAKVFGRVQAATRASVPRPNERIKLTRRRENSRVALGLVVVVVRVAPVRQPHAAHAPAVGPEITV